MIVGRSESRGEVMYDSTIRESNPEKRRKMIDDLERSGAINNGQRPTDPVDDGPNPGEFDWFKISRDFS